MPRETYVDRIAPTSTSFRGFTVIELMVAVAVLGVLLAIAVPSFLNLLRDSQRASAVNDLLADLTFARSESVRRGRLVAVCSNPSGDTCGSNAQWSTGWLVFEDTNGNLSRDGTEPVLRRAAGRTASLTVTSNQALFDFRPFNRRTSNNGTVNFCDPRGATQSRSVVVPTGGRPRVDATATCS